MIWLWGLGGAFIYAAPRLVACVYSSQAAGKSWAWCGWTFVVSLVTGAIAAGALAPFASNWLSRTAEHDVRAIATLIGLLANPFAPDFVRGIRGKILKKLDAAEPTE
jgi:hypothetical protein